MSKYVGDRTGNASAAVIVSKSRVFAAVAIIVSVVASLALCEVMARLFAPPWLKQHMAYLNPDPSAAGFGTDQGWKVEKREGKFLSFTPYSRFEVSHVEFRNVANIDEFGGRRVPSRVASNLELLPMLGDSFTFGIGVEDEETFVSKLAAQLPTFRVLNFGLPGSALHQQIQIIQFRHAELNNPRRYIIFFFIGNDFADLVAEANDVTRSQSVFWVLNDFVHDNSVIRQSFSIQFSRRVFLQLFRAVMLAYGIEPEGSPLFNIMDQRRATYQAEAQKTVEVQLVKLKTLQKKLGFTTMIVAIPDAHQLDDSRRQFVADGYGIPLHFLEPFRPNQLLKNVIEKEGFEFFDTTECLVKTKLGGRLYYQQDTHFRAIGHDAVARCMIAPIEAFLNSSPVLP